MRLLNIETFQLETFYSDFPDYATLSHTWGNKEITFQEFTANLGREKKGWNKIVESTIQAAKHKCKYIWVDTCCIDKSSSAELSEAINSMFRWYRTSKVCFAYLEDLSVTPGWNIVDSMTGTADKSETASRTPGFETGFANSRWFKRGWTLQELIAPKAVQFFDSNWNDIGDKGQLKYWISTITGIDSDVLQDCQSLYTKSIARRMSWASDRETTRTEDIAYCLIGIFKVNMPLLYGEGEKAFVRLQEMIMQSSYNHSLFAWNHHFPNALFRTKISITLPRRPPLVGVGFLAPHPVAFKGSARFVPRATRTQPYAVTNMGLQIFLRILKHDQPEKHHTHFAILQCGYVGKFLSAIAIPIAQRPASKGSGSERQFYRSANKSLIEVEHSQAIALENQTVYFLTAGDLSSLQELDAGHRCWLRKHVHESGIRIVKARYCQYPLETTSSGNESFLWQYGSRSMSWSKSWPGSRAAIYFSNDNGRDFVVVLTFLCLPDQGEQIGMNVQVLSALESSNKSLRKVLVKDLDYGNGFRLKEAQTTWVLANRLLNIRVKQEMVFDETAFVVDLVFPGIKRENPALEESSKKRQKGYST